MDNKRLLWLGFKKREGNLADFLAPLPLETCVERLNGRHGKFFAYQTGVYIRQRDSDYYEYRLRVLKELGRSSTHVSVVGTLQWQDATTTRVTIRRSAEFELHPLAILGVSLVLGIVFALLIQNIIALVFMLGIGAVTAYTEYSKYNEVVDMIHETLGGRPPRAKGKPE
jgi:hypothetical protein